MRYIPQITGGYADALRGTNRPPLELLPADLAKLLRTLDDFAEKISAAQMEVNTLADDTLDDAARREDADAAARAARAGKPIPAPVALPKLQARREQAARNLAAQRDAYQAVSDEAMELRGQYWTARIDSIDEATAKARAEIEAKAADLADTIEAHVRDRAVFDWLANGSYIPTAQTWPVDAIPDLERIGIGRRNSNPIPVRDIITAAAVATLD